MLTSTSVGIFNPNELDLVTLYVLSRPWVGSSLNVGRYWTTLPALPTPVIEDWYLTDSNNYRLQREQTNSYSRVLTSFYTDPGRAAGGATLYLKCGMTYSFEDYWRAPYIWAATEFFTEPYAIAGHVTMTAYVKNTYSDVDVFIAMYDDGPASETHIMSGISRLQWRNRCATF